MVKKEITTQQALPDYQIVNTKTLNNRVYQLVEVSSRSTNRENRSKSLRNMLNKTGAIGLIEWWAKGSIIKKPKQRFRCILISKCV
jgi:hypothetical protein